MKKWMLGGIFMLLLPWLLALACMTGTGQAVWGSEERMEEEEDLRPSPDGEEDNEKEAETEEAKASAAGISRRILIERDGISTYMNLEDYLPGVVVCQIPEEYEREALKCQTVIARTYICRLMDGRQEISEEELDLDYLGQINEKENRFLTIGEKERLAERLIQCSRGNERSSYALGGAVCTSSFSQNQLRTNEKRSRRVSLSCFCRKQERCGGRKLSAGIFLEQRRICAENQ